MQEFSKGVWVVVADEGLTTQHGWWDALLLACPRAVSSRTEATDQGAPSPRTCHKN